MEDINDVVAKKFCELCDWTYQAWVTHKVLFDSNPNPENSIGRSPYFTDRLAIITQEYALQQIARLHDPWCQRDSVNLTISYIVENGCWGNDKTRIDEIASKLNDLYETIKPARNKILSHNDRDVLLQDAALGSFTEGDDDRYFEDLQCLVNEVHQRWIGGPFPFNDLAKADALEFIDLLGRTPPTGRAYGVGSGRYGAERL